MDYDTGRFCPNPFSVMMIGLDIARNQFSWLRNEPRSNLHITELVRSFLYGYYRDGNELPKVFEVIEWGRLTISVSRLSGHEAAARFKVEVTNHWVNPRGRFPRQRNFVMLVSGKYLSLMPA